MDKNRKLELLNLADNTMSDAEDPIEESDIEIEHQIEENLELCDNKIDIWKMMTKNWTQVCNPG